VGTPFSIVVTCTPTDFVFLAVVVNFFLFAVTLFKGEVVAQLPTLLYLLATLMRALGTVSETGCDTSGAELTVINLDLRFALLELSLPKDLEFCLALDPNSAVTVVSFEKKF
jgi:hypothetical protein